MKIFAHTQNLVRDAQRFEDVINLMVADILRSPAGGAIVISVPENVASAQAELTLNPVPVAARHDGLPVPETAPDAREVEHEAGSHVETSGNGISGLVSASETPCGFPFGSL